MSYVRSTAVTVSSSGMDGLSHPQNMTLPSQVHGHSKVDSLFVLCPVEVSCKKTYKFIVLTSIEHTERKLTPATH